MPELGTASTYMTDRILIDRYRSYLANTCWLACNTVLAYAGDVGRFLEWLDSDGRNLPDMDRSLLANWVAELTRAGRRRRTVIRHVSALQSFYSFLALRDPRFGEMVPSAPKYPMKSEKALPSRLTYGEIERLLAAAGDDTPYGLRDLALLEMLYATGLRLSELHEMELADLDRLEYSFEVIGKGEKKRKVFYGIMASEALFRYLEEGRPAIASAAEPALWVNRHGGRLSKQSIGGIVRRYARLAGLRSGFHPHSLRRSFATPLLKGGANFRAIQKLMGHSGVATTQIYAHVDKEDARDALLQRHPLAKPPRPRLIIRA